jgi:N-acetylmuramoyl-L-alanine amidase
VEAFQHLRGLRVDGVCGSQTWNALVEAGFHLGDRFLYRRTPMLRGDDVAELQRRLSTLGFDAGRVDGIFGDRTSRALAEFQRNVGLPVDGIAGGATLRELIRLESRYKEPELISAVRARTELRHAPATLSGRRVAIGESGGLGSVAGALRRRLVSRGTQVTELHHPDDSAQAHEANELEVDVFLGLRLSPSVAHCHTSYWAGRHDASQGGRLLAELVQRCVPGILGIADAGAQGMSLTILRETRMPTVLVEVGPASLVVERSALLAASLSRALELWADASWD